MSRRFGALVFSGPCRNLCFKPLIINTMNTTETTQQGAVTPIGKPLTINADALIELAKKVAANDPNSLEFELREERIVPYKVDITKPFFEPKPMISIDGASVATAGNISAIVGESKSKKTFLASAIVAAAMAYPFSGSRAFDNVSNCIRNNVDITVLWLDTEQSISHVRKVIDRINNITGIYRCDKDDCRLNVFALRELEPRERRDLLRDALFCLRPTLVVIDGVADLLYDSNDLRESESLVGELMALSTTYNCHIINILHTNPGTDKARGHIGSALQRKSESVIYVHKVDDTSIVEPQFCRNEPFERFAFSVSDDGIPELCSLPTESQSKEDEVVTILRDHFGGAVERSVLTHKLEEVLGVVRHAAQMRIRRAIDRGNVTLNGKIVALAGYTPVTETHERTHAQGVGTAVQVSASERANVCNQPLPIPATPATYASEDDLDYVIEYPDDDCPF